MRLCPPFLLPTGLGPALVGAIIAHLGRTAAFNIAAAGWVPCGLLLMGTALTLERDEEAMQCRLRTSISMHALAGRLSRADAAAESEAAEREGSGKAPPWGSGPAAGPA